MVTDTSSLTAFQVADARIVSLELTGKHGVDTITKITYADGQFVLTTRVVTGPQSPGRVLDHDDLLALLAALKSEQHRQHTGVDQSVVQLFVHLLTQALRSEPSARFDHARFGDVAKDASGAIVGHLGFGVDMAGTVHDASGAVTFEQHVVPMHPGAYQSLSRADRGSLAANLEKFLAGSPNPLWSEVVSDLKKQS